MVVATKYPIEIEGKTVRELGEETGPGITEDTVYILPTRIHLNGQTRDIESTVDIQGKQTEVFKDKWTGHIECEGDPDIEGVSILEIETDPEYGILEHKAVIEYEGKVYRLENV
jgi:hypothetical protein